jgi:hypothetical protein
MRQCCECKEIKLEQEFYKRKDSNTGLSYRCKKCHDTANHKDRERNPNRYKNTQLMIKFNISLEYYNKMFEEQLGCCAICGMHQSELKNALGVDHNHKTGKIRGLLCTKCNIAIGMFNENLILLDNAKTYLTINNKINE